MDGIPRNLVISGAGERPTLSRAGLIQAGAAAAAAIALPPVGRSLGPALRSVIMGGEPAHTAAYLRRATYLPLVGEVFEIALSDGNRVKLRLVEARALPGDGDAFSLVFRSGTRTALESAIHTLTHPALGSVDLFLGPVGRPVGRTEFEAVVNRIRRY
jgi:hypothetical protein